MSEKEYFRTQAEQADSDRTEQFHQDQSRMYGEEEWMNAVYEREISRFKPIIDAINDSPGHTVTINGYKCSKDVFGYHLGMKSNLSMIDEMVTIMEDSSFREIRYNGSYFVRPLGSIRVSSDVNNRHFDTIGNKDITADDSQRTILENADHFHYSDQDAEKEKNLDLRLQLFMMQGLGIQLTQDEQGLISGYNREETESKAQQIKQQKKAQEKNERNQIIGDGEWIQEAYKREFARLQPVLDIIDKSGKKETVINGYICRKNEDGDYEIGCKKGKYGGLINLSSLTRKDTREVQHKIEVVSYSPLMPLGSVQTSNIRENNRMTTIALGDIGIKHGGNTILENAMTFQYNDPQTDKIRQAVLRQVLMMLGDLRVELTPTEKMEMLKGKKQYLENELAKVDEQIRQQDPQQI